MSRLCLKNDKNKKEMELFTEREGREKVEMKSKVLRMLAAYAIIPSIASA